MYVDTLRTAYQCKITIPLTAVLLSSQIGGQCDSKAIEREKTVVALSPKEASKCHKEDLAKAFYVRIEFVFDASVVRVLAVE